MYLDFQVTKENIRKGRKGNPRSCAVALALKDTKKFGYIDVTDRNIWYKFKNSSYLNKVKVTKKIAKYVKNFDNKKSVKPDTFRIKLS